MAANFPSLPVLNKAFANNSRIAPNANSNNTVVEHKDFDMAHPQRVEEPTLTHLLDQLDFSNTLQQTNGVIKGTTEDGGLFQLTAGVLKMTQGDHSCGTPPPYNNSGDVIAPVSLAAPKTPPIENTGTANQSAAVQQESQPNPFILDEESLM